MTNYTEVKVSRDRPFFDGSYWVFGGFPDIEYINDLGTIRAWGQLPVSTNFTKSLRIDGVKVLVEWRD